MPPMTPTTSADTAVSNSSSAAPSLRHARSRTQSISSDRPSTVGYSLMTPPLSVSPDAAFIAASAASQIVTNEHDGLSEAWYDEVGLEPSGDTALVTPGALQLANNFVDQLLFNIIASAGSTSLATLRPAVSDVLKPKLAKDAMNQADEELQEYLGGGEIEDLVHSSKEQNSRDWDLELVWKRTRLRCMVYSSLGDMEEEDEDYFMEQEHLTGMPGESSLDAVSPAVAIFLTSILEYIGEQVLVVAGQAAFNRLRMRYEKELKDGTRIAGDLSERVVVEELDMERVALDRTLGRLWRSWKKRIRSPTEASFRAFPRSATHSRRGSSATDNLLPLSARDTIPVPTEDGTGDQKAPDVPQADIDPSTVPLPMGSKDVDEIEVPGLVSYSDDDASDVDPYEDDFRQLTRPKSLVIQSFAPVNSPPTPSRSQPESPVTPTIRRRANSLPTPAASPFISPGPWKSRDGLLRKTEQINGEEPPTSTDRTLEIPLRKPTNEGRASTVEPPAGKPALPTKATGRTPPLTVATSVPPKKTAKGEEEEFEEPEILTSARVSISGSSGFGSRPPSLLPARSSSMPSPRMIDVQGPRSPSVRSRNGSLDSPDLAQPRPHSNVSREGSVSTPPIAEEIDSDTSSTRRLKRGPINVPVTPSAEDFRVAEAARELSQAKPPTSMPSTPSRSEPAGTKVTILSSQPVPSRPVPDYDMRPEHSHRQHSHKQPPMPTLPEKSSPRQTSDYQPAPRGSPESPSATRSKITDSPASSTSARYRPVRSSEEGNPTRPQDVARNFEELLQNDQTLQYTLTPESMRDANGVQQRDGATSNHRPRHSEDTNKLHRSRSSSLKRSLSITKTSGLSSHPVSSGLSSHPLDYHTNSRPAGKASNSASRPPPVSMANYQTRANGQTRDARVQRDGANDFADFIRSTGPPGAQMPPARAAPIHVRKPSGSASNTRSASADDDHPREFSGNRVRLQARDAAVSASNESSDLIDFIRRGPPNGNNPRIPRHVAPFRSTMDSDQLQMSGAGGGRAVDAVIPDIRSSQVSTAVTEHSVQSSINSQSALLSKAKPAQYTNSFDDDDMIPKRKQRRVRDPYAIDFSDEEDDDDLDDIAPAPKPKPRQEESLIDFLNSYEPPPDPTPRQPFILSNQPPPQPVPKKKASAPNLISRLRSSGSVSHRNGSGGRPGAQTPEARPKTGATTSTNRGYTPITVNIPSGADLYSSITPAVDRPSVSSGGRVPMKRFEPRDATSSGGGRTSDLARFLRDSEPPPSSMVSPPSPVAEERGGGGFFRRKKPAY